jgi:hypothetical protein
VRVGGHCRGTSSEKTINSPAALRLARSSRLCRRASRRTPGAAQFAMGPTDVRTCKCCRVFLAREIAYGGPSPQKPIHRLLSDNALTRIPLRVRAGLVAIGATAASAGEGQARPISKLNVANQIIQTRTAVIILVCTSELIKSIGAPGQALLSRELKGACADQIDQQLLPHAGRLPAVVPVPDLTCARRCRHV